MNKKYKHIFLPCIFIAIAIISTVGLSLTAYGAEEAAEHGRYYATWLALVPPVIAIALALITKEVYSALFIGILSGAMIDTEFHVIRTITSLFAKMTEKLGDSWNVGILLFLVFLGILVTLMNKAGGSAAYGRWAGERIKSKKGVMLSTVAIGALIFVDDYFNCLTVGSVMRPVTDKFKMSRAKLAYIIDATAAPVCIIAPISSWAAAVTSSTAGTDIDGFKLFIQAIPYNLYAILTLVMLVVLALTGLDFGPMAKNEKMAEKGDLTGGLAVDKGEAHKVNGRGKVIDLVAPVAVLIFSCIMGMVYTGGFFDGEGISFAAAFAGCDASVGLVLGSFVALVFTFLLYIPRRIITFKDFTDSIPEGFKAMISPIIILTLAWTLSGFCRDSLGAGEFVGALVQAHAGASRFLPAIIFLIALGLTFATGTSWGTFGILLPIILAVFNNSMCEILVISVSACLAGAVCGDHISPISDTTIMASAGAESNHINHVYTQLPYALTVAAVSFLGYIFAGIVQSSAVVLPVSIAVMVAVLVAIKIFTDKKAA